MLRPYTRKAGGVKSPLQMPAQLKRQERFLAALGMTCIPCCKGSCVHQAGDYVVDGNGADGAIVGADNAEHAEVVLVEEFEDVLFAGIGGNRDERIGFEFGHVLFGNRQEYARDGRDASEVAEFIEEDDIVELLEIEFLAAEPFQDFVAGGGFTDEREFVVDHP